MVIKLAMRWPAPARFSSSCSCSSSYYGRVSIGSTSRAYIATIARGTCRRRRRASAAAKTTTTDPRAQTLALRPRLGLVLWGLAGLEERPERNVVLPPQLTALLAPGPRGLARVDDGRAGLHLLVLSVGETRRLAIHTSNLKHVPRRRRRLPSQMRRPRPRDPLRAHRSRAETGARRSPAYRRGYVR